MAYYVKPPEIRNTVMRLAKWPVPWKVFRTEAMVPQLGGAFNQCLAKPKRQRFHTGIVLTILWM